MFSQKGEIFLRQLILEGFGGRADDNTFSTENRRYEVGDCFAGASAGLDD